MPCIITEEYTLDDECLVSASGILELDVIAHKKGEATFSESEDAGEGGLVNGVLTGSDAATAANWKSIEQEVEIAEATETLEGNRENGAAAYSQSVMITMHYGSDPVKNAQIRRFMEELVKTNSVVVVTMQDGSKRIFGRDNGLRALEGTGGTGKAMTDLNGLQLTLSGKEKSPSAPLRINEPDAPKLTAGYQPIAI